MFFKIAKVQMFVLTCRVTPIWIAGNNRQNIANDFFSREVPGRILSYCIDNTLKPMIPGRFEDADQRISLDLPSLPEIIGM